MPPFKNDLNMTQANKIRYFTKDFKSGFAGKTQ